MTIFYISSFQYQIFKLVNRYYTYVIDADNWITVGTFYAAIPYEECEASEIVL